MPHREVFSSSDVRESPFAPVLDGHHEWHVERSWPQPDGRLLAELKATTGQRIAGQWFSSAGEADAALRQEPCRVRQSGSWLLHPEGIDRVLPQLHRFTRVRGARLIGHRLGKRGVVQVPISDGFEYVKVLRRSRLPDVVARSHLVAAVVGDSVRLPRLRGVDEAAVRWSSVPGETLFSLSPEWSDADMAHEPWFAAGVVLATLHRSLSSSCTESAEALRALPSFGVHDELRVLRTWAEAVVAYGLLPAGDVRSAVDAVGRALMGSEPGLAGVLHRDLHDKQLLWDGHRIGVIDVDTAAIGERALDIGNMLAHLELRVRQGRLQPQVARSCGEALVRGLSADEFSGVLPGCISRRVNAWEQSARLRLALVYAFRPRWRSVAQSLLRDSVLASPHES